jgi:hypothetical protein
MDDIQKRSFIIVMCYQQKPDFKHCPSAATDVASSTLSLVLFISMELSRA